MSNILSYSSLTIVSTNIPSKFGGSSKYKVIDGELIATTDIKKEVKPNHRRPKAIEPNYDFLTSKEDENPFITDIQPIGLGKANEAVYKLKKSKIKKKCLHLADLKRAGSF